MKVIHIPTDHEPFPLEKIIEGMKRNGREFKFGISFCINLNGDDEPTMLIGTSSMTNHREIFIRLDDEEKTRKDFPIEMGQIGGMMKIESSSNTLVLFSSIAESDTFPDILSREDILEQLQLIFLVENIEIKSF